MIDTATGLPKMKDPTEMSTEELLSEYNGGSAMPAAPRVSLPESKDPSAMSDDELLSEYKSFTPPAAGSALPSASQPRSAVDTALPPAPSRGYTTEFLAGAKKIPFDITSQVGNLAATLSPQGSEAEEMANKAVDWAQEKREEFAPASIEAQKGGLEGFVHQGVSEILPATATSYATAALPSAAVVAGIKAAGWGLGPIGKLIAHGVASGVGGVSFGLSQYNDTYRNLRGKFTPEQMSDDDAKTAALKTALIEGAGETLANFFLLKLLGAFGKSLVKEGTKVAEKSVVSILKPGVKELARQGVREGLPVLGTEVGTEVMQGVGQIAVQRDAAKQAGWSEEKIDQEFPTPASAGASAIIPAAGMTIISALLGGGRAHLNNKAALNNLQNSEADPKARAKSLEYVLQGILENEQKPYAKAFKQSKAEGASDAEAHAAALDMAVPGVTGWFKAAEDNIRAGQPIDVNQRLGDISKTPQGSTPAPSDQNLDILTGQNIPSKSAMPEPGTGTPVPPPPGSGSVTPADKAWESALGETAIPTPEPPPPTPDHAIDLTDYQPTSGPTQALKEGYMQSRQEAAQGAATGEPRTAREQNAKAMEILKQVLQEMDQPETALPATGLQGTEPPSAALPVAPKPTPPGPTSPAGAMEALPPVDRGEKAPEAPEAPTAPGINLPEAQAKPILSALPDIGKKAHEAATSPLNALPQPSEAQKSAGNYKKGHMNVHGLDISIENPRGSIREGKSREGKSWARTLRSHYGYIKGTVGRDKEHIDSFIGQNPDSQKVFVVDQIDPKTGKFDEHKAMLGFASHAEASQGYRENYEKGWTGAGAITEMTMPEFKAWLKSGNTKKALAYAASKGKKTLPGLPERSTSFNSEDRRSPDRQAWDAYDAAVAQGDTEKAKEIATKLAYKDRLTGLTRREGWEHDEAEGKHAQYAQRFFLDLDNFHDINEKLSHEGGDLVLAYFGKLLRFHLGEGAEAARWGGDEFVGAGNADLEARLKALQEDAANTVIPIDLKSGEHREQVGVKLSFGIGKDYAEAYSANTRAKEERKEAGLRHDRETAVPGIAGEKPAAGVEVRTALPEQKAGVETALPPGMAAELSRPDVPLDQSLAEMTLDDLAAGNEKSLKYVKRAVDRLGKARATDELFNKSFSKAIENKTRPEFLSIEPALRALLNGESIEAAEKLVKPEEPESALPKVPRGTPKAAALPPAQPVAVGRKVQAKTERGTAVDTQFEVMNAADLVASHTSDLTVNPAYPKELQPRDRGRAASELQISNIMQRLEPEFLGESPKASEGAPIIGGENVVESGNGRVIAIKRLYERGEDNAKRYRQWLMENAERFGLDRATIEKAKTPVLVRRRLSDVDREAFVKEANEQSVAAMSASEQALSDSKRLTPEVLAEFAPGEDGNLLTMANREFIKNFMRVVVGQAEAGRYLQANGSISQEGVMRMRNAIFAKAYGESDVLEKLAESTDSNVKNITNAMLMTAADFVKLRRDIELGERYALDISGDISAAVRKLSDLRDKGEQVKTYIDQIEIAPEISPLAKQILTVVDQLKRSAHKIAAVFKSYVEAVENLGSPHQEDMFGGTKAPSAMELFGMAIGRAESMAAEGPRYSLRRDAPDSQPPLFTLDDFRLEVQEAPKPKEAPKAKKPVVQESMDLGLNQGTDLKAPEHENKPVTMDQLPLGKAMNEAEDQRKQVGLPLEEAAPSTAADPAPVKTVTVPIEKDEIVKRYARKMADEHPALRSPEAHAGYVKSSTGYFNKLYDAIQGKDIAKLKGWLHQGNQNSVRFFNEVSGTKVRTDKQIAEALRTLDPKAYDKLISDQREADEKGKADDAEKELQKLLADKKYDFNGKTVTAKEMIDSALADGFTGYSEKKRGITTVVTLSKGNKGYEFKTTSERAYIKRRLEEMKKEGLLNDEKVSSETSEGGNEQRQDRSATLEEETITPLPEKVGAAAKLTGTVIDIPNDLIIMTAAVNEKGAVIEGGMPENARLAFSRIQVGMETYKAVQKCLG